MVYVHASDELIIVIRSRIFSRRGEIFADLGENGLESFNSPKLIKRPFAYGAFLYR